MVGSRARLFMGGVAVGASSREKRLSRSVLLVGYAKSRGISERRSILERVFQYVSAHINGIFYFLFRSGSLGDGRLSAAFAGTFLSPLVSVMRSLPTMAVILIILVWTTPVQAPVAVAFLALFPLLYSGIFSALKQVDGKLVEMSKIYRVPIRKQIFGLYLPSAAPYVLREAAAALSFSLKLTVSAEVLANTYQSIGGMMQEAKIYVEVPALFALTALVVIAGFLLEGLGAAAAYAARRRI